MSLITDDPDIHTALQRLDRALTPAPVLATKAVAEYRGRPSHLTQAQIDNHDIDDEGRRRRFVGNAVAFRRRSLFARLCWWR